MNERPAYQQRVIEEKQALDTKLAALQSYRVTDYYNALPLAERVRLERQDRYMSDYSAVLGERIEDFTK